MLWLGLILFFQETFYYLDGVEIHLVNGTIIKTASSLKEDLYFYSWEEGSVTVNIEKNQVKTIRFFSMRIPGKAPKKKSKTYAQRRLTGKPAAFSRNGDLYLRYRHVDRSGRSAEGNKIPNRVREIAVENQGEPGFRILVVNFVETTPETNAVFRFYNLEGKRLYETVLSIEPQKKREKKARPYRIKIPEGVPLKKIGLVEVVTPAR